MRAKVYEFGPSTNGADHKEEDGQEAKAEEKKFNECGVGDLHVNTITLDNKTTARFVMRSDKTHRAILNAPIYKGMPHAVENDKFIRFTSFDLEGKTTLFLLRFKNAANAVECNKAIDTCIAKLSDTV
jgi:hypothetical protein